MKHMTTLTLARPAAASLLETQQKVTVITGAIAAFNSLAGAIGNWLGLLEEE